MLFAKLRQNAPRVLRCKVAKTGGAVTILDRGYASGVIAQSATQVYFAALDDLYRFTK